MDKKRRNEKEKNILSEWAAKNDSDYQFPKIDKERGSYFMEHQGTPYIREYEIETLPELFQELDSMWRGEKYMEEIIRTIGVAAFKNKPSSENQKQIKKNDINETKDMLPEFIYNF